MLKIGVIGRAQRAGEKLPAELIEAAEQVGTAIARHGAALISGGTGGVMEAAARGAKRAGGLTVGFLPQADASHANPYLDLAFPTGLGTVRNVLTARCADALVALGGGVGTLNELTLAYDYSIPVVVVEGTGGWSERIRAVLIDGRYLDERQVIEITFAATPDLAVNRAVERAATATTGRTNLVGWAGQ